MSKKNNPNFSSTRPAVDICSMKVVLNSVFNRGHLDITSINSVSNFETIINLMMAQLSCNLERKDLHLVTSFLSLLNYDGRLNSLVPMYGLPQSHSDWRKRFADGKHSLRRYLPSVKVIALKEHAVVDPRLAIHEIMSSLITIEHLLHIMQIKHTNN
jgi:hypothetical protein